MNKNLEILLNERKENRKNGELYRPLRLNILKYIEYIEQEILGV